MVAWQPQRTLDEAVYLNHFQSGFKPGFGTETALITLMVDLWWDWDGESTSILSLLDLLVTFNSIDHGILLGGL